MIVFQHGSSLHLLYLLKMKKTLIKSEDMPDQIKIEMGSNELSFAEELKMDG